MSAVALERLFIFGRVIGIEITHMLGIVGGFWHGIGNRLCVHLL